MEALRRIPARNGGADGIDKERAMAISIQTTLERLIEAQSRPRLWRHYRQFVLTRFW
jgi:hypothetical protein